MIGKYIISKSLDGVIDLINTIAKRIVLYNLTEIPSEFIEMADLILTCAKEIDSIFNGLKMFIHYCSIKFLAN